METNLDAKCMHGKSQTDSLEEHIPSESNVIIPLADLGGREDVCVMGGVDYGCKTQTYSGNN